MASGKYRAVLYVGMQTLTFGMLIYPEGVASRSPGLPYSATLGAGAAPAWGRAFVATPTGLRPPAADTITPPNRSVHHSNKEGHNPVGVGINHDPLTQGSRVRQPLGCEMQSRWDCPQASKPPSL